MEESMFDPYYVAEVLSDLLSRQRGREVTIILDQKRPSMEAQADDAGG